MSQPKNVVARKNRQRLDEGRRKSATEPAKLIGPGGRLGATANETTHGWIMGRWHGLSDR